MLQLHSVTEPDSKRRTWNLKAPQWRFPGYVLRDGEESRGVEAAIDGERWGIVFRMKIL
jgi:hypothetical protein